MKVYIVIVTYNGMQWLPKCLASIPDQYSVVVIDNNSTDNTVHYIEQNFPQIKLFKEKKNLGFGQANNKGISYALKQGAEFVYLLNQDAYLEKNTISKLIEIYKKDKSFGILSPFHYKRSFTGLDNNFLMYLVRYKKHANYIFDANESKIKEIYEIPFVNAAGWLLPKQTLEIVGGFDPMFFHYGEDRNYCQRVLFHKLKIGIVPNAKMIHDRENREKKQVQKYSKYYYQEYLKYAKIDWGDINLNNFEVKFANKLSYIRSKQRKFILKLNLGGFKDSHQKYKLLKKIYPQLQKSRAQNRQVFHSYL